VTKKKRKKRQCKSLKGIYFFKKGPKLLYFEGQFFFKNLDNKFQLFWGKPFSPPQVTQKEKKEKKAVQILQRNFFFEKRPKIVAMFKGQRKKKIRN